MGKRAIATAVALAGSAATTVFYILVSIANVLAPRAEIWWAWQIGMVLGGSFDTALALLCAGLVGPIGDRAAELSEVGKLAAAHRERQILQKLVDAAQSSAGPALALAALLEVQDPNVLI